MRASLVAFIAGIVLLSRPGRFQKFFLCYFAISAIQAACVCVCANPAVIKICRFSIEAVTEVSVRA